MSDDELDITKSLALSGEDSSDYESNDEEFQDEILSSDDENSASGDEETNTIYRPPSKSQGNTDFPALEVPGNDEGEVDRSESRLLEYFAAPKLKKAAHGTFPGLGLSKSLIVNITRKGFKTPTPIQRKTVPLILDGRDVVGMARTGSGKTAAFVLPMIEKLKVHSARIGARAIVLSPSRELALQTLKVVKEFSKGTGLRCTLLVGGDSLDEQFSSMMTNPDIIIATPGRFMHLKVEMQLDLKSIEYIVFDEADRLFEMGFAEQLNEIIAALPTTRQTLLFSATLPKSLVEFAQAGLQEPVLVRLDIESKVSDNLEMAFFSVRDSEREAGLAYILQNVIKMPFLTEELRKKLEDDSKYNDDEDDDGGDRHAKHNTSNKRDRKHHDRPKTSAVELPSPESTIVFVPTKHDVEYITHLLKLMGYGVSCIYGSLDQTARKRQLFQFRAGLTSILVVTDVAARGIDIPVLANVINFSLPASSKVFVHRVGRTARAGRRGWAYSLVRETDLPYLLDLEIFLGRKLLLSGDYQGERSDVNYSMNLVLGSFPEQTFENILEDVDAVRARDYDIQMLQGVAKRGEKLYLKTREPPSAESIKRAKEIRSKGWNSVHVLFGESSLLKQRQELLDRLGQKRLKDTVFEFKKTTMTEAAELMSRRRRQLAPIQERAKERKKIQEQEREAGLVYSLDGEMEKREQNTTNAAASDKDLESVFGSSGKKKKRDFRDPNFFMSHYASLETLQEKGYGMGAAGGSKSFAEESRAATFDVNGEGIDYQQKQGMKWDRKRGKFINAGSEAGKDGRAAKYIRGESGQKIAASFRSGRFDAWKMAHKTDYKTGAMEQSSMGNQHSNHKFKHNQVRAPKLADKSRDDYYSQKKKVKEAVAKGVSVKGITQNISSGLKSTDEIRKQRQLKEKRREKNARPSKKTHKRR